MCPKCPYVGYATGVVLFLQPEMPPKRSKIQKFPGGGGGMSPDPIFINFYFNLSFNFAKIKRVWYGHDVGVARV